MSRMQGDVVVAGHICLDIIPTIKSLPGGESNWFEPGRLTNVGQALVSTGGAVSNTGIALHRLGLNVKLMGKIGNDLFGKAIRDILTRDGNDLADSMIVAKNENSSYTIVISPPQSDRTFFHCTGANDTFVASDLHYEQMKSSTFFHFGYPPLMRNMYIDSGKALASIFHKVKSQGMATSLDMAKPDPDSEAGQADWRAILQRVLPVTDVFLPSLDEILFMLHRTEHFVQNDGVDFLSIKGGQLLSSLSDELLEMGSPIIVLKLGEHGLYLRTTADWERLRELETCVAGQLEEWHNRELYIPCFNVRVRGTTGAGDCTIAGFIASLLRGLSPEETLTCAVGVGACNVEQQDATSGIIGWDALQQRIAAGWQHCSVALPLTNWQRQKNGHIWIGPNDRMSS